MFLLVALDTAAILLLLVTLHSMYHLVISVPVSLCYSTNKSCK